jgi:hypothetical protein
VYHVSVFSPVPALGVAGVEPQPVQDRRLALRAGCERLRARLLTVAADDRELPALTAPWLLLCSGGSDRLPALG